MRQTPEPSGADEGTPALPDSLILRMGSPREPIFNSIQARRSAPWTFTSGILSRDVDGSLRTGSALDQAAVIAAHLTSIMRRARVQAEQLVLVELYWHAGAVDPSQLEPVLATVIPEGAQPAARCICVSGLNSRGLVIEVAFTFHEGAMTDAQDAAKVSDALTAPARWAGDLLLVSGQADSLGPDATLAERYAVVLDKIVATVRAHGLSSSDIVQTTTYIVDEPQSDDFGAIGDVRRAKLSVETPPVGSMVRVAGLADSASRIEISAIATPAGSASRR